MPEPTLQRVHTTPAPNPLPPTWAKAIANDIAATLTRNGWQPETKLRAWSATGNPSGNRYHTPGSIPGPGNQLLPTTELISNNLYTWGSIDPHDYPGLNIPPLAYALAQLDLAQALNQQPHPAPLIHAAQGWLNKCRNSPRKHETTPHVYRRTTNRHGNPRLQRNEYALEAEANVFLIAAQAATVHTIDPLDYQDALNDPTFNATAALRIIEAAIG